MLKHEFVNILNSLTDKELEAIKREAVSTVSMGGGKHLETALLEAVDNFVTTIKGYKLTDTQLEAGAYIPFNQKGEG